MAWAPIGLTGSQGSPVVAFGSQDGGIYLFDVERRVGRELKSRHGGAVEHLRFSPDGAYLLSSASDNQCLLQKTRGDERLFALPGRGLRFSRDGRRFAVASNRDVSVYEISSGQPCYHEQCPVDGVEFSPDGRFLAVGGKAGARLLDAVSLRPVAQFGLDPCGPPAFEPNGRELLTYGLFTQALRWPIAASATKTSVQIGPPRVVWPSSLSSTTLGAASTPL